MLSFIDFLLLSLLSLIIFFLIWYLFIVPLRYRSYYSSVGIKCERFIPLFGDLFMLKDYALRNALAYFYTDFFKRHQSKIVQHLQGPSFTLLVGDSTAISSILSVKNSDCIEKAGIIHRTLGLLIERKSVVFLEGKAHKMRRKILSPMFHFASLRAMIPSMHSLANKMIDEFEKGRLVIHESDANQLLNGGEIEVEMEEFFPRITLEIVIYLVFGASFYSSSSTGIDRGTMDILYEAFAQNALLTRERVLALIPCFPLLSALPLPSKRKMENYNQQIDAIVDILIRDRIAGKTKSHINGPDLLDLLIKTTKKEFDQKMNGIENDNNNNNNEEEGNNNNNNNNKESNDAILTVEEIKHEARAFVFAGFDTSSTALTWIIYFISDHPETQIRLKKEVDEVLEKNDGIINEKCLGDLCLVEAVIQESLRLYPVVPLLPRTVVQDCVIDTSEGKPLLLKKGIELMLSFQNVHRDKQIWGEDVDVFNPDRFLKEKNHDNNNNDTKQKKRPISSFFPFSSGNRSCLGMNFAMNDMKVVIASLIARFDLRIAPGQTIIPELVTGLRPLNGLKVLMKKRNRTADHKTEEKYT